MNRPDQSRQLTTQTSQLSVVRCRRRMPSTANPGAGIRIEQLTTEQSGSPRRPDRGQRRRRCARGLSFPDGSVSGWPSSSITYMCSMADPVQIRPDGWISMRCKTVGNQATAGPPAAGSITVSGILASARQWVPLPLPADACRASGASILSRHVPLFTSQTRTVPSLNDLLAMRRPRRARTLDEIDLAARAPAGE